MDENPQLVTRKRPPITPPVIRSHRHWRRKVAGAGASQSGILIAMAREASHAQEDQRFLLVRSGSMRCALLAADVVRIARGLVCYPIPGSQARLLGLAQYGGEPLPVLDLHVLVVVRASGSRHRSTVILGRGRQRDRPIVGLAVDEVLQVVSLPSRSLGNGGSELVADLMFDGDMIKVVNTGRLLSDTTDEKGL